MSKRDFLSIDDVDTGELVAILRQPDVVEKIASQGGEIIGGTPAEFAAFVKADSEKWSRLIRERKLQLD